MKEMSDVDFIQIIEIGHETRNIEWKPPFSWSAKKCAWMKEKVIQTIQGLANIPGGGKIIIGIKQDKKNNKDIIQGLTQEERNSFDDYDGIKGTIDGFCSAGVNFTIEEAHKDNKICVVISINEFDDIPIICRKNGTFFSSKKGPDKYLLRQGDIYCRKRSGEPGTIRVTEIEMREIIERTTDKQYSKLKRRHLDYFGNESQIAELFKKQQDDFQ